MFRLYANENLAAELVEALQQLGYGVSTRVTVLAVTQREVVAEGESDRFVS